MKRLLLATLMPMLVTALFVAVPTATAQEHSLTGTVLDQDGEPVVGAAVQVYQYGRHTTKCHDAPDGGEVCESEPSDDGHYEARVETDSQGGFAVPVQDGWLSIEVRKDGHAGHHESLEVNGSEHVDIELLRYPDKTAHIVGQVTGGGAGLDHASVSVENPEYGIYECSVHAADGDGEEPRPMPAEEGGSADGAGSDDVAASEATVAPGSYPYRGCAITVEEDGTFRGNVTPGYSLVRFHHDAWRSDGQAYYAQTRVIDLPADATTRIDVELEPRPGPDARLSGYVIDGETDEAIPDVHVSFSNQEAYGWAGARTDGDGSYKAALRSGYTHIHVRADGYFPWEGQVQVRPGEDGRFDILLTPGESRYGGCCIAYAEDGDVRTLEADGEAGDDGQSAAGGPIGAPGPGGSGDEDASTAGTDGDAEGSGFEDLGGGLGPYDAASRSSGDVQGSGEDAPAAGILLVLAALLGVLWMRRR